MTRRKMVMLGGLIASLACIAIVLQIVANNYSEASSIPLSLPADGTPLPISSSDTDSDSVSPTPTSTPTSTLVPSTSPSSSTPSSVATPTPTSSAVTHSTPSASSSLGTSSPSPSATSSSSASASAAKTPEQVVMSSLRLQALPVAVSTDHRYNILIQCNVPTGVTEVSFYINSENPMVLAATVENNIAKATITDPLESGQHQITVTFTDPANESLLVEIKRLFYISPVQAASMLDASVSPSNSLTTYIPVRYIWILIAMLAITTTLTFFIYRQQSKFEKQIKR